MTLSALQGQVVVLDFWASWCSGCVEALPHLQGVHERYADRGVEVLAVNVEEDLADVVAFVADYGYTFTILLDDDGDVGKAYGVNGIPHVTVIDQQGQVHYLPGGLDAIEEMLDSLLDR